MLHILTLVTVSFIRLLERLELFWKLQMCEVELIVLDSYW